MPLGSNLQCIALRVTEGLVGVVDGLNDGNGDLAREH